MDTRHAILCSILTGLMNPLPIAAQAAAAPRIETHIKVSQLEQSLDTPEKREYALKVFQELGITKVYLETLLAGRKPGEQVLRDTRDFFRARGIEVSASVATTAGGPNDLGTPANQPPRCFNYESEKTRRDMAALFRWIAGLFDEIMINDYYFTNDTSEISERARGSRTWAVYRKELLRDFARRYMIEPAREANPKVQLILKYPQWYEDFDKLGYDVEVGPKYFNRIWVGTETRDPDTPLGGYVMPTEGYIVYTWLHDIAGAQTGGGWFDFVDCNPEAYLMQAYQTVLAQAREIFLATAGSLLQHDACMKNFVARRGAVLALGGILAGRRILGMPAYLPPHSEGSDAASGAANYYVHEYIGTLGLSPVMLAAAPERPRTVFLSRHAASDPHIAESVRKWLAARATVLVTPDFLAAANDAELTRMAGFAHPLALNAGSRTVTEFRVEGREVRASAPVELRALEKPAEGAVVCSGISAEGEIPLFTLRKLPGGGRLLVLNVRTFSHEEFTRARAMTLAPRRLSIRDWPAEVANRIRRELSNPYDMTLEAPNNVGVYWYEGKELVLANFNREPARCVIRRADLMLDPRFPHRSDTRLEKQGPNAVVTVPSWELAVLRWY